MVGGEVEMKLHLWGKCGAQLRVSILERMYKILKDSLPQSIHSASSLRMVKGVERVG
jgi:hypothetical protein